MADSMIPYSFIPGTKAKAGEVNANFIALADAIENNRQAATGDIEELNETLETKADKTELITSHTVTDAGTDLNNYKTDGTYIFSSLYTPYNIPKGASGVLIVTGLENSAVKQIWFCDGDNPEIYTRKFENYAWGSWYSHCGVTAYSNPGYYRLPNGLIIQWGYGVNPNVTYPIAYSTISCPVFGKVGCDFSRERSDTGFEKLYLTGMVVYSGGIMYSIDYIVIGF